MLEALFNYLQTPFGLFRLNIDNLQRCNVGNRVSREISKITDGIDNNPQGLWCYLRGIHFIQKGVNLFCQVLFFITMCPQNCLETTACESRRRFRADWQNVAGFYVVVSNKRRNLVRNRPSGCPSGFNELVRIYWIT